MNKIETGIKISGFIDRETEIIGDIKFKENFRIDGVFKGKILSGGGLIIGETGEVEADIDVDQHRDQRQGEGIHQGQGKDRNLFQGPGHRLGRRAQADHRGRRVFSGLVPDGNEGPGKQNAGKRSQSREMKIAAVIPSRYQSSRFPGKPLAKIAGKTMIERVYRQVAKAGCFADIIVATDDRAHLRRSGSLWRKCRNDR